MRWQNIYRERLTSAEKAVKVIKSGDMVVFGHACGEPKSTVDALVERANELENVRVVHMASYSERAKHVDPGMENHFRLNNLFVSAGTRRAVNEGRADFTPVFFHDIPLLFTRGELHVDIALIQVSPPDKHGYCSYGISVDYTKPCAELAKVVIAEVNHQMPRTHGDSFIHVSDIDYIVECDHPLYEIVEKKIGKLEKLGENVASLIEDGATLQLGIGGIPNAVLQFLKDKNDLGVHTEMLPNGAIPLVESGIINCKMKTLHPGKMVATFFIGTKELYDFVDDNPFVEMYPVSYVNDPFVISKNYKMTSVNSFIQIDLLGNVNSETTGWEQYSAVGGQVDFIRGAIRSEGGKAILAANSTAASGKISRIVPCLDKGASVTTSRNDVQYIVTEHGIANLRGKTLRERANALINIAHPDFRDWLRDESNRILGTGNKKAL